MLLVIIMGTNGPLTTTLQIPLSTYSKKIWNGKL